MAKNPLPSPPKQQTPAMSTSHTYTVGADVNSISANEDDDNDICPVCDGECTCDNRPRIPPSATGTVRPLGSYLASNPSSHPTPSLQPSLKIRLTVPPGMLGKIRCAAESNHKKLKSSGDIIPPSGNNSEIIAGSSSQNHTPHRLNLQSSQGLKRRGRPPKISNDAVSASGVHGHAPVSFSAASSLSSRKRKSALPQNSGKSKPARPSIKAKRRVTTKINTISDKKRRVFSSGSSGSELTDQTNNFDLEDDPKSPQFPSFVSASAMSLSSNDSDASTSSLDFDTDSSMEAEEENFIVSQERRAHDKARVRRELLGRDDPPKRRDPHNDWVIRPRKKSVGSSDDVDIDGESDEITDDEEEEDDDETSDEEEPDGMRPGGGYAGVATSWSEDDESSFDADLFFASLSDSTIDQDSSQTGEVDDDKSDGGVSLPGAASSSLHDRARHEMNELRFEVVEGWDGQIIFTNGLREGQGVLDIDFEVNAAQLVVDVSPAAIQHHDTDVQMSDGEDGEYEEDEFGEDETDGETTEEDLVDENGLPTERAMKLFQIPCSVSAINPMSTLSPTASPSPRNRRRFRSHVGFPKPADILAGKIYDLSDQAEHDDGGRITITRNGSPAMGQFEFTQEISCKRAIITGSSKDIPSPYPRHKRPRNRSTSRPESLAEDHSRILSPPSSLSGSSFQIMSSEELLTSTSADLSHGEPIDWDDVLDASLLDSDVSDRQASSSTCTEVDSRNLQNLSRWDVISVGAFRQTLETSGNNESRCANWNSDAGAASNTFAYANTMKTNTLGTMMFDNQTSRSSNQTQRRAGAVKTAVSPVLLPVCDGDQTPTDTPPTPQPPPIHHHHRHHHTNHKTRKELRRENKTKRKSYSHVNQHYQQHHHHQHHPNMKTRSSSSMQRTNFFSSPASSVPPLNL